MARVSVIIPTHNRVEMLVEAVASAQSAARDIEVIVVDDASTDRTPERIPDLGGLRYIRVKKNVGQAAARNIGIEMSSAPFIAFLDDDDRRLPGSIDLQVERIQSNPAAALVYGKVMLADSLTLRPTGEFAPHTCPRGDLFLKLLHRNFIYCASVLARREKVIEAGLFRPTLTGVEDWDLWIRMAETSPFESIETPVAIYRDYSDCSGQTSSNRIRMCHVSVAAQALGLRLPRAQTLDYEQRSGLEGRLRADCSNEMISMAKAYADSGRFLSALRAVYTAARLGPHYLSQKVVDRVRRHLLKVAY